MDYRNLKTLNCENCYLLLNRPVNLLIGPPAKPRDTQKMLALFFSRKGRHIVCGGTTSNLVAQFLGKPLVTGISSYIDPDIPPIASIEGVDLVTEGVITINRALEYARDHIGDNENCALWKYGKDGVSRIARFLFEEATEVYFFAGKAVNPAHQNPGLPGGFNLKIRLVEELASCLKIMGKQARVSYF
jgi:hypothetical protein